MRVYVALMALVVMVGCPGSGQEMRAADARRGRPEPTPAAAQIDGPAVVQPYHLGRYRVRQEWPFYQWRVEPAGADVQPIGNGNVVDIVAKPGTYTITLTVGGRRGKSQDITKSVEFAGENPTEVDPGQPTDPIVEPPGPAPGPGPLDNHDPIRNPSYF